MNEIIKNGVVISQFEFRTSNTKSNLIKRNKLMAMFFNKIVVVEATKDSGALYIAYCEVRYGNEVYSVRWNINSKSSKGTNNLINEVIKLYLSINTVIKEKIINRKIKWIMKRWYFLERSA